MSLRRGAPRDLDAESQRQVARSFFVVRMVKGCLLLACLVAMLVAVDAKDWPRSASFVVGVAIFLELAYLLRTWFRYRGSRA